MTRQTSENGCAPPVRRTCFRISKNFPKKKRNAWRARSRASISALLSARNLLSAKATSAWNRFRSFPPSGQKGKRMCWRLSNFTGVKAIRRIGPTLTSILGALQPLTAVVLGAAFLDEHLGISSFTGIAMILVAVIMIVLHQKKKKH